MITLAPTPDGTFTLLVDPEINTLNPSASGTTDEPPNCDPETAFQIKLSFSCCALATNSVVKSFNKLKVSS